LRIFHKKHEKNRRFFPLNENIFATTLRVIDSQNNQIGILTKEEALKKAYNEGVDLVLIAPNANPPVAKLIDFKKFLYQLEKKEKEAKKGVKKGVVKDIQLSLFIGPADLERLINKGKEFLEDGHQLRISLTLKGREIVKKQMAFDLINRFISQLGEINLSKPPRLEGRVIRTVLARKK
jgi:translation initiation factor IF-3